MSRVSNIVVIIQTFTNSMKNKTQFHTEPDKSYLEQQRIITLNVKWFLIVYFFLKIDEMSVVLKFIS